MPIVIDPSAGITGLVTPLAVPEGGTGSAAVPPEQRIGVGQTWQNLFASRAMATTYTNGTGRPIMVAVRTSAGSGADCSITINGVLLANDGQSDGASTSASACWIVPAGNTYVVNGTSLAAWTELR